MEPLIALVVVTVGVWAVGAFRLGRADAPQLGLRAGIFAMFMLTGIVHFVGMRAELVAMVPSWLPHPELVVTVTGVLEIAGAVGMLIRPLVPWAGLGLSLLLLAMFPANVELALSGSDLSWWDELVPRSITQVIFLAATSSVTVLTVVRRSDRG